MPPLRPAGTASWRTTPGGARDPRRRVPRAVRAHRPARARLARARRRPPPSRARVAPPVLRARGRVCHSLTFEQRSQAARAAGRAWRRASAPTGRPPGGHRPAPFGGHAPAVPVAGPGQPGGVPGPVRAPPAPHAGHLVVCGARFFSASHGPRAKTCGPACATAHRRELGRTLGTAARPEVRAQLAVAARCRRAGYDPVLTALRELDAAAVERLPAVERDALRLYYGLHPSGARPRSLRELTAMTGLRRGQVERVLTGSPAAPGSGRRGLGAACAVCGRPFAREAVNSARVTCSPACAREQSRATLRRSGGRPGSVPPPGDEGGTLARSCAPWRADRRRSGATRARPLDRAPVPRTAGRRPAGRAAVDHSARSPGARPDGLTAWR